MSGSDTEKFVAITSIYKKKLSSYNGSYGSVSDWILIIKVTVQ